MTKPATPAVSTTLTLNPNTGVISSIPTQQIAAATVVGGKQPQPAVATPTGLTLFNTVTAGQNVPGAVQSVPSIVVTPTSRPPVTQVRTNCVLK